MDTQQTVMHCTESHVFHPQLIRVFETMADTYLKFLNSIDWADSHYVHGIQEGKNKFLSNLWGSFFPERNKYLKTMFISRAAREYLGNTEAKGMLVFEHIVPKQRFIQKPCEALARENKLTKTFILERLKDFWIVATITKEEEKRLLKNNMPDDWNGSDPFARYRNTRIELDQNDTLFIDLEL